MTRRMLINAQTSDELRVAIVNDSTLESYQFDVADAGLTQGNIYRARIARIEPSLNAAFIDYGVEKHGFLASQDVVAEARYKKATGTGRPRIQEVLEKGRTVVVQVTRDPEGRKGAALNTNLSLAGRFLVLTPFDSSRGVSRKVESEEERKELRKVAASLEIPDGCGVVVRTNARDQSRTVLNRDLAALLRIWRRIKEEATKDDKVRLLYADQDLILRAMRDYLDSDIEEILVDDEAALVKAERYLRAFMPRTRIEIKHYTERLPLFSRFGLEAQIENIYQRSVPLPSGGSIVIEGTEALTAIDVNSGRATQRASQEDTALQTNLEAAAVVGRQLRLRDIGGLIVVDFIDMRSLKHRGSVEKALRDALKTDKARTTVSRISRNGLLEVNRQRLRQPLRVRSFTDCPVCAGRGRVPSPELASLRLLRRVEARAATGIMKSVRIRLHPAIADAFQNQRRKEVAALEVEFDLKVEVVSTPELGLTEEEVEWVALSVQERDEAKATEEAAVDAEEMASQGRRSRKIRPAAREEEVVVIEPPDDDDEFEDDEFEDEDEDEQQAAADDKESKPRRSRSRRGRRRRGGSRSASGDDSTGEDESGGTSRRKADSGDEDKDEEKPKRGSRRPRRRRSSRGAGSSESKSSEGGDAADNEVGKSDEKSDEKSRSGRRPRRRRAAPRTKKSEGESADAGSPPAPPADVPPPPPPTE